MPQLSNISIISLSLPLPNSLGRNVHGALFSLSTYSFELYERIPGIVVGWGSSTLFGFALPERK